MTTIHLEKLDDITRRIVTAAFPGYSGRKFKVQLSKTINVKSFWDGGSRSYYSFVKLDTMQAVGVPAQHPMFNKQINGADDVPLLDNIVCVEHSIFCGKDMGLTIHVSENNISKFLPEKQELDSDELVVLRYTRSLKSSYAGISNYRRFMAIQDDKITLERWETAKISCISKGLLNKAGAITIKGENTVGDRY